MSALTQHYAMDAIFRKLKPLVVSALLLSLYSADSWSLSDLIGHHCLLADTDVFLTSFKPEVLKNFGLDCLLLQQCHPR